MKKLVIILISILSISHTLARTYPVSQVAKPSCKYLANRDLLPSSCKIKLPIIQDANYNHYKSNNIYRLIYSVLWTATYKNWRDVWYWSHLWVDIVSAKWTPVLAIWDGIVTRAWWSNWWWNVVVIKHSVNGTTIYSNYAHLDRVLVKKWQRVQQWQVIGKIWNSWYAWGNHLHFQIDLDNHTNSHPYYYNCWGDPGVVVNNGECQDQVKFKTLDPILFLEQTNALLVQLKNSSPSQVSQKAYQTHKVSPNTFKSREQILKEQINDYLKRYSLHIKTNTIALKKWDTTQIFIQAFDKKTGKPKTLELPRTLRVGTTSNIRSNVSKILIIPKQWRFVTIKALRPWKATVRLEIGPVVLKKISINIYDSSSQNQIQRFKILTLPTNPILGKFNIGIAVPIGKFSQKLIGIPWEGNFQIKFVDAKGCLPPSSQKQALIKFVKTSNCISTISQRTFNYQQTYKGILIFKFLPQSSSPAIQITNWKIMSDKKLKGTYPIDIFDSAYSQSIIHLLQKGKITIYQKNKFAPNLFIKEKDFATWLNLAGIKHNLSRYSAKPLTRWEIAILLSKSFGLKSNITKPLFKDIPADKSHIFNRWAQNGLFFKDKFGKQYFQPNKPATRAEAAFMLEKIIQK